MASAGPATFGFVRASKGGVLVKLRVLPGSKTSFMRGPHGGDALKLSIAAPPVDGEANAEVERFLAGLLGVAPSGVAVVHGVSSREKSGLVRDLGEDQASGCLDPLL